MEQLFVRVTQRDIWEKLYRAYVDLTQYWTGPRDTRVQGVQFIADNAARCSMKVAHYARLLAE